MDTINYLRLELDFLRRRYGELLSGVTNEQFNWTPPGSANSIGVNLLHGVSGEDMFVHQLILEKPTVWERQEWSKRTGLELPPGGPSGWEEARKANLKCSEIMQYQEAVCEETSAFLNTLTPEALDRPAPFFGSTQPLAFLLAIIVFHSFEHLGEISALKGIQEKQVE